MKKEQIKNFNYVALIKTAQQNEEIKKAVKALGYNVDDVLIETITNKEGLNGKFKKALLKVYREMVESTPYYRAYFNGLEKMFPQKEQRHFIIVGDNNYWCSNISIDADKDIDAELQNELESLRENIDSENMPEEFTIYETLSSNPLYIEEKV